MNLEDLRKEPHISYSQIHTYLNCSLKYKLGYIDQVKADFTPLPLVFGSCMHQTLAVYYQNILEATPLSLEDIQNIFCEQWDKSDEQDKINFEKDTHEGVLEKGKALLGCFYEHISSGTVIAIEEPFKIEIDSQMPPFIGAIDLIEMDKEENIIIVDHKTSSSRYSNDKVEKDLQMTIYSLATQLNGFVHKNPQLRFDILVKTKTPQFQRCPTSRTHHERERAIRIIKEVWNGIQKGIFIPNDGSNSCSSCQYQSYCEHWG